jgi:hypothetical protein
VGSPDRFADFRRLVLDDPALQERLRSVPAWPAFAEIAVEEAAERGVPLTAEDVLAAREAALRTWLDRWV